MTTVEARKAKTADLGKRAAQEMRHFVFIAAYMLVIFAAFAVYRRLVLHEVGVEYLHYGASVIAALVVAKVVLAGEALRLGQRYRPGVLIAPVLYKTAFYTALVVAFVVLERVIEGLVHGEGPGAVLVRITSGRRDEILANTLMVFVAFIPFFALLELHRMYGEGPLFDVFLRRQRNDGGP